MRVFQFIFRAATDLMIALIVFVALYAFSQNPAAQMGFQNGLASLQDRFSILQNYLGVNPQINYGDVTTQAKSVVEKTSDSVVSVYGRERTSGTFSSGVAVTRVTAGTGFFVSNDGYILTNKHVVSSTSANYTVVLSNGRKQAAEVAYRDPNNDLAVLKVSGTNYQPISLGDSSKLTIGQPIVAVGNVGGKGMTATGGSISGLRRLLLTNETDYPDVIRNTIQITAQLYPGDSGGPVLDMNGNVVGINVATSVNRANESFAIPINDAKAGIEAAKS